MPELANMVSHILSATLHGLFYAGVAIVVIRGYISYRMRG